MDDDLKKSPALLLLLQETADEQVQLLTGPGSPGDPPAAALLRARGETLEGAAKVECARELLALRPSFRWTCLTGNEVGKGLVIAARETVFESISIVRWVRRLHGVYLVRPASTTDPDTLPAADSASPADTALSQRLRGKGKSKGKGQTDAAPRFRGQSASSDGSPGSALPVRRNAYSRIMVAQARLAFPVCGLDELRVANVHLHSLTAKKARHCFSVITCSIRMQPCVHQSSFNH